MSLPRPLAPAPTLLLATCINFGGLLSCAPPPEPSYSTFSTEVMATTLTVAVPAGEGARGDAEAVFAVFREVDARMSEWKEGSPLAEVNRRAGGEAVPVPEHLRALLHRSLEIAERTGGAFDPTWAALWGLWDFRAEEPRVPEPEEIEERLALVDYHDVEIDDEAGTVRLPRAGMKLGLGAVAKGYALDRASAALRERGVESFLVTAGGQVYAGGRKRTAGGERPWTVGVRDPRGGSQDYFATLPLVDTSASTSGDYEAWFEVDGERFHHVIDPRTGYPARAGLISATVVSPDATLADALSTALLVVGEAGWYDLVRKWPDAEAVVVRNDGDPVATPGLVERLPGFGEGPVAVPPSPGGPPIGD